MVYFIEIADRAYLPNRVRRPPLGPGRVPNDCVTAKLGEELASLESLPPTRGTPIDEPRNNGASQP